MLLSLASLALTIFALIYFVPLSLYPNLSTTLSLSLSRMEAGASRASAQVAPCARRHDESTGIHGNNLRRGEQKGVMSSDAAAASKRGETILVVALY
jgi:hypothetical protein